MFLLTQFIKIKSIKLILIRISSIWFGKTQEEGNSEKAELFAVGIDGTKNWKQSSVLREIAMQKIEKKFKQLWFQWWNKLTRL